MHTSTHLEQTAQTPRHSDIPPLQTYSYTHTRKDTHSTDTNSPKDTYTNPYTHIHTDTHMHRHSSARQPPHRTHNPMGITHLHRAHTPQNTQHMTPTHTGNLTHRDITKHTTFKLMTPTAHRHPQTPLWAQRPILTSHGAILTRWARYPTSHSQGPYLPPSRLWS